MQKWMSRVVLVALAYHYRRHVCNPNPRGRTLRLVRGGPLELLYPSLSSFCPRNINWLFERADQQRGLSKTENAETEMKVSLAAGAGNHAKNKGFLG